jgi:Zn-dependent protease
LENVFRNLDWSFFYQRFVALVAIIICMVYHELSHGIVSYKLGDKTAKTMGRLSLNPIKHIDLLGMLAFVFVGFGWAKPVQVDPRNFKKPKRDMAITAFAGPLSNFVMAAVFLFILGLVYPLAKTSDVGNAILDIIYTAATFSVVLGIFNMIPVPPLDGSKVLFAVASDELYAKLMRYERFGLIFLIVVIFINRQTGFLSDATDAVMRWLWNIVPFAEGITKSIMGS